MRVLYINSVPYGSTGKIMYSLADLVSSRGGQAKCVTGFSWHKSMRSDSIVVGNIITKSIHRHLASLFGNHGCYSSYETKRLIKIIKKFKPDVVHLHNIHGWYLNFVQLFDFLNKINVPIIWTLHDCWAFTGGCAHFTFAQCSRWRVGCGACNNLKVYPISSKFDKTKQMWKLKKSCFTNINNLTIVTPSEWLAKLVHQSYLKEHEIKVINNGIDTLVFKQSVSKFRKIYNISSKQYIVLGVALGWGNRKGLDVFVDLSGKLPPDYKIVLIGTDEIIDRQLPQNIISIHRTQNQEELAEIYSVADVFVNPTREDTYPTVNMEAISCGTPVITFRTGGSPEMIDATCGVVVECDDVDMLEKEIKRICTTKPFSKKQCVCKSKQFDKNKKFEEYLDLYEKVIATRD